MPLEASTQALLEQLAELGGPPLEEMEVPAARQMYLDLNPAEPITEVGRVEDRAVPGPAGDVPVRVYTPRGGGDGAGVVYFHGGGWVIGDLQTHDELCRSLCEQVGAVVVAVDYRLAPEHRYPAAAEDCIAATAWVAENAATLGIDASRIAVAGDSAGGNLAAVVAQVCRDRGGPRLRFQLLLCPVVDHSFGTASYQENADGYLLTRPAMEWFWGHYLGDGGDGSEPLASPLNGSLEGLPPAHVVTVEFDPLRDEGEAYAAALAAAGVETTSKRYDGQIHNFFAMGHLIPEGGGALAEIAGVLRAGLLPG
ncbi:MAG: alpha/beta hydrolase [Thermoanaerobaculia bacterium]|nr:alpha/beta hydrolase [Thermoanaerobaculia bacterium]